MVNIVKKVALVAALGFASSVFAAANNPDGVAVVDLTQVFQQVPQGQAAFNQLQKSVSSQASSLQSQQDALNKKIQAFQAQQASLTVAQRNAQQADLITQQAQLQKSINDYQASLKQSQQKLLTSFGDNMKGAVSQISQANGYHLVLSSQTAIYSDNSVDITPQVISAMKKK